MDDVQIAIDEAILGRTVILSSLALTGFKGHGRAERLWRDCSAFSCPPLHKQTSGGTARWRG